MSEYEPIVWKVDGAQKKDAFLQLLQAIIETVTKTKGDFFTFEIKIEERVKA